MDAVSSHPSAKRRRLDVSINPLPNPTFSTSTNPDPISHYRNAQPVPQERILDSVQAPDPRTGAVHLNQQNDRHPSKHHLELPSLWNDADVILPDHTLGTNPAAFYNHALNTDSALQFHSFQYQLSSQEFLLSTPNPPNEDQPVGDNGSEIEENTMVCYGMVSILHCN
jgi:hypothetical protein